MKIESEVISNNTVLVYFGYNLNATKTNILISRAT